MEWVISVIVTIIGIWCGICFIWGLLHIDYYEELYGLPIPIKITFIAEICMISIFLFALLVSVTKDIIF